MRLTPEEIDELVLEAEQIIASLRSKLSPQSGTTGHTQMSNAIDAAQQTRSFAMFLNWLRYQMAREDFWRTQPEGGRMLGEQVADRVKRLQSEGERGMEKLVLFLGFLRRALVAIKYLDQIPLQTGRGGS
ncbi:MAG: hypothetical protein NZL85_04730 [Fimbriimonadales bacterium]|nr:hypothetical protein [Fimbriimonadales bacterium]